MTHVIGRDGEGLCPFPAGPRRGCGWKVELLAQTTHIHPCPPETPEAIKFPLHPEQEAGDLLPARPGLHRFARGAIVQEGGRGIWPSVQDSNEKCRARDDRALPWGCVPADVCSLSGPFPCIPDEALKATLQEVCRLRQVHSGVRGDLDLVVSNRDHGPRDGALQINPGISHLAPSPSLPFQLHLSVQTRTNPRGVLPPVAPPARGEGSPG